MKILGYFFIILGFADFIISLTGVNLTTFLPRIISSLTPIIFGLIGGFFLKQANQEGLLSNSIAKEIPKKVSTQKDTLIKKIKNGKKFTTYVINFFNNNKKYINGFSIYTFILILIILFPPVNCFVSSYSQRFVTQQDPTVFCGWTNIKEVIDNEGYYKFNINFILVEILIVTLIFCANLISKRK
jgi:hypothetical protein